MMDGLIIDSFAGGGGASTGIERALGRSPDIAINHDPEAVAMHEANHPATRHYCRNVWQAAPADVVHDAGGGPVALAWFSPDCKHFSKAKGAAPVRKSVRDLAWVVVVWAKQVRPAVIMLENVEEFQTWGPIDLDGKPCPKRRGEEFNRWIRELKRLGYRVEWRELRACDYGAPTIRKRLFLIARRDGAPIVWPEPTHAAPTDPDVIAGRKRPWRTAAEIIDWSIPCPSIFERKRELADNTQKRIARGLRKFVIEAEQPFVVPSEGAAGMLPVIARIGQTGGRGSYAYDVESPLTTITSKAEHLLVSAHISRQFGCGTGHACDRPLAATTGNGGGKSALVTAWLAKHFGGVTGVPVDTPVPTVTTRGTQTQLVTSHLLKFKGTCRHGQPLTQPMPTVQAGGMHVAEVRAFLMKYYGTGGQLARMQDPCPTLTALARLGLVTVHGQDWQIIDIGMRMLTPRELFRAQGFDEDYILNPMHEGKPLGTVAQIRMCGNSVCPDMAKALVAANLGAQTVRRAVA